LNKFTVYTIIFSAFACIDFLLCTETQAINANLTIPREFHVLAVNGKKYLNRFIQDHQLIPLTQEKNRIAMKYQAVWSDKNNNVSTIKSKVFIVNFYLNRKENFRLTYIKPATLSASIQYSKSPHIKLVNDKYFSLDLNISFPSSQSIFFLTEQTRNIISLKKQQNPIIINSNKNTK